MRSCGVMMAAPPETPVGAYAGTVADWRGVCDAAGKADANAARDFFEQWFAPMAIGGDALFTGYYEPQLHASVARHGRYQTPVYGLPSDLVTVDLGRFRDNLKGQHIAGRVENQRLVPYPDRADIDADGVRAREDAVLCRRSGGGVLPAYPGLGPRRASTTARRRAWRMPDRTGGPTPRSAAR